ncbi:T-cell surface glycoprotein CD1c3-like isoform X2 [Loxodonta africana]|uniref:T-cell surface glycoprotein CD1c3-like isoform X2 n=1 Tax=Loxodonta africana TaxID=9785 RepID=UPI0030CD9CFD
MLFLQLPLLAVFLPGGNNEEAIQKPISFQLIQISSFANQTWAQNQGSGWLDELQTHSWESELGSIIFLHTWSKGNFSDEELMDLELLFRVYFTGFIREVQDHASALKLECIQETVHGLIRNTCPRFVLGLLDAGRMYLQRQVRPQAWLSSSPTLSPDWLLLVCHVSGFYPKPVWVMWMRGEQELPGTKQGGILPNADGTWYLWVILNVKAEDVADLSCWVRHSSLGSEDIIISWGHHISMNLTPLAVVVPLTLLIGLALWFKKRCSYQDIL